MAVAEEAGQVLGDLEANLVKNEVMERRVMVMAWLIRWIKERGWTQMETARFLGVPQSRICRLLMGKAEDFTLDRLLVLATRAGMKLELRVLD
jgi:predicted XRE-type DNA-binding protein